MKYAYVAAVIGLVTYGQLIIKYRIDRLGPAPEQGEIVSFLVRALTDIGIISGLAAAVLAAMAWMLALTRLELSAAYPLLAINFLLVPLLSIPLFGERVNAPKLVGLVIVVTGLVIFSIGLSRDQAPPSIPEAAVREESGPS